MNRASPCGRLPARVRQRVSSLERSAGVVTITLVLAKSNYILKENTTTMGDLIKTKIAKLGENISVSRFVRFKVGEAVQIEETAETSPPVE